MTQILISVLSFIVALGVLIAIHEFGHFWVARKLGVKVLRYSIGFGKPLWTRRFGPDNTEYVLAALPLGGYVKMLDEREGPVEEHELGRAFNRQRLRTRFAIVFAGPLFNILFALFAYWLMFVIGITGVKPLVGEVLENTVAHDAGLRAGAEIIAVADTPTPTWDTALLVLIDKALNREQIIIEARAPDRTISRHTIDLDQAPQQLDRGDILLKLGIRPQRAPLPAVIDTVEKGGAAQRAGLQGGDRIITVDGRRINDWEEWASYIRERPDKTIELQVARGVERLDIAVRPAKITENGVTFGRVGASPELPKAIPDALRTVVHYPPGAALVEAATKSWEISVLTLRVLGKMLIGQASIENLSGPISIAEYAGYSASDGIASFLRFLAIVSISLGILNLLPIPVLDGGHLMYYLIEAVKGSPVSQKLQLRGQQIGIALLLSLMVLAFYNDLNRLFG